MSEADPPNAAFAGASKVTHASWILVVSYIFILSSILISVIRLIWRWKITKKVATDDWLIIAATLLGVAETAAITISCNNGLGQHQDTLSDSSYEKYSKSQYAAQMLTIATVGLAKLSLIFLFVSLEPPKYIKIGCHVLQAIVVLWVVGSIFAIAFQCPLPQPWVSTMGSCVNQLALQIAVGTINIATDLGIVLLPVLLMPRVQTTNSKRLSVQALFACRLIVPIMTVLNLTSLAHVYNMSSTDQSWMTVTPTIYGQCMLNLSLITASIPSIKKFLAEFQSGVSGAQVSSDFELSLTGSKTYTTRSTGACKGGVKEGSFTRGAFNVSYPTRTAAEPSDSIKGLTDDVILQTFDFKVEYEDGKGGRSSMES